MQMGFVARHRASVHFAIAEEGMIERERLKIGFPQTENFRLGSLDNCANWAEDATPRAQGMYLNPQRPGFSEHK